MNLGGQAGAGARHRLGGLTAGGIGAVRMHPHCGAIDHDGLVFAIGAAERLPNRRPQARLHPSAKAVIDRLPLPKHLGQLLPQDSRAQYPQDRLILNRIFMQIRPRLQGPLRLSRWALIF